MRIMTEVETLTHVDAVSNPCRELFITNFATFIVSYLGSRFYEFLKIDVIEALVVAENPQKVFNCYETIMV